MHASGGGLRHEQLDCVDGRSRHHDHGNEGRDNTRGLKSQGDGEQGAAQKQRQAILITAPVGGG